MEGMEGGSYSGRRVVAIAQAISVEVREVPAPRPATFCGGIGNYHLRASASPTALRVGDPLTFTLDVERGQASGSLDLIRAPISRQIPRSPPILRSSTRIPPAHGGQREAIRMRLRPKRPGALIPALTVSVFDPDTEKFREIATNPIAVTVSEGSRVSAGELVGSLFSSGARDIKSREQGIWKNVTDPRELKDQRVNVVTLAGLTAGLWCGVGCLIAVVSGHRRKSGDLVWQRKRHAHRSAERKSALAQEGPLLLGNRRTHCGPCDRPWSA